MKPDYVLNSNCYLYKKYRIIIYGVKYQDGAYTVPVNDIDYLPDTYQNTTLRGKPVGGFPQASNIKLLYDRFIEFRPQMQSPETALNTVNNDTLWGKDNTFELDTYINFPNKVIYNQNNIIADQM